MKFRGVPFPCQPVFVVHFFIASHNWRAPVKSPLLPLLLASAYAMAMAQTDLYYIDELLGRE
jgi:hypothetical protein